VVSEFAAFHCHCQVLFAAFSQKFSLFSPFPFWGDFGLTAKGSIPHGGIPVNGKKFFTFLTIFFKILKRHARPRLYSVSPFWAALPAACGVWQPLVVNGGPGLPNYCSRRHFMNNLNSILIEGNLVRDPLLRSTPKGTSVCSFTLASNRFFRQDSGLEKEVGFFDVETWAKLAEHCYNQGRKGRGVRVVGRLKQDRWSGADGKSHSRIAIVAEHVEFRPEFNRENTPAANPLGAVTDDNVNNFVEAAVAEDGEDEEFAEPMVMAVADPQEETVF
jgi:single-strand DNA-binding protein